ncbi:response regulator [Plebeiibacterium sediminum]|uniref:Response regulator transcription factor n=1 Tax=Plebeiibacterium sediminum TaxID=2992112 RepID=A0AAE3M6P7_9BACT|nr:response regulator transcription factor [Plebeiobacterium sediminum]MCW3788108.1 response regulator transcription factor [Plebeiobacterium sediminum]
MTGLHIIIVDDHDLFREGLKFLLSTSSFISHISEAKNGDEFINSIQSTVPDIVLMDIEMPVKNGIEATKEALQIFPSLKIIALSMYAEENFYRDMIDAGARGFLLKNSKFKDVEQAIADVYDGKNYFSPEILNSIIKNLNKNSTSNKENTELSKREQEVLFHICKGLSNQEIADVLYISKRTVDKHRENILLKSQSKNTAELVVYAIKKQYFEL